ncbi:twin-arginine translocation signal domain-containing protein [Vibrio gallicus]|uniref:twin-arginine translocation signal domain-containing protein n=1 Tax=Vibrio gallicus TaxID=190897 RepID=UPI0021C38609|nr:twin-arginine translocation signal domain-containing protein [Vibrio gallicus]
MKDRKNIDTKRWEPSRRELLKGMTTAVVAGGIVAGTAGAAHASSTQAPSVKSDENEGYQETQHIRDYYDTL